MSVICREIARSFFKAVGWSLLSHVGITSAVTPGIRSAATQRTHATFLSPGQLRQHITRRTKWKPPPSKNYHLLGLFVYIANQRKLIHSLIHSFSTYSINVSLDIYYMTGAMLRVRARWIYKEAQPPRSTVCCQSRAHIPTFPKEPVPSLLRPSPVSLAKLSSAL